MRIRTKALIAGIVGTLMGCSEALAIADGDPQPLQNRGLSIPWKLGTNIRSGTITFLSKTRMVIALMHKGKSEQLEFVLNSETVQRSETVVGDQVTVHYRTDHNHNIATSIQNRK